MWLVSESACLFVHEFLAVGPVKGRMRQSVCISMWCMNYL